MSPITPPGYAWDWFTRQRLLWQEARTRLADGRSERAPTYRDLETRPDVVSQLRSDYPEVREVRVVVDDVVREVAFLDRTGQPFDRVVSRSAPRGLRWWWGHLSGEDAPPAPPRPPARTAIPDTQLTIADVLAGYGDDRSGTSSQKPRPGSSGS